MHKRILSLGVALPLLSGCGGGGSSSGGGGGAASGGQPTIGFVQFTSNVTLDQARDGYLKGLAEAGYEDGKTVKIIQKNAQADQSSNQLILQDYVGQNVDLIATASTMSLQAAMKASDTIPIVFSGVADPLVAGAGESDEKHRPNVTGVYNPFPIEKGFRFAKQCVPSAAKIGTLYDPGDVFIESFRAKARAVCAELGVEYVESAATSSSEIIAGVQALKAKGVDAIMQLPGVNLYTGIDSLIKTAKDLEIPVFSVEPNHAKVGAIVAIGVDFYEGGRQSGALAAKVLKGEKPEGLPLKPVEKEVLAVNKTEAAAFGITIPADLLKQAQNVIGN